MTLDEARARIGSVVIYENWNGKREQGVITSVNDTYVFVCYGANVGSQATGPDCLEFLSTAKESTS